MGTLTGKTAVVTGSTSGIGLAYARAFAGAGANIVLNGMGAPADIEKERSAIEADRQGGAFARRHDQPAEIADMIALGKAAFGSSILVNNAGISSCRRSRIPRRNGMRHRDQLSSAFTAFAPRCPA
jgi:3-hydroxybutyrate dehydrogenase